MGLIGKFFGKPDAPDPRFLELRTRLLSIRPSEIGLSEAAARPIFGIVMETGTDGAVATFACLADGTVSVYFSNGSVIIGGGQHESVRSAAAELFETTNQYAAEYIAAASSDQPSDLPRDGRVQFHLLTNSGRHSANCSEADLEAQMDPFANLYTNCHMVMSEVRAIEQERRREPSA